LTSLPDGTEVLVRPLRPEDAELLVSGFEHLSSETRHRRFLSSVKHLTPQQVRELTHPDGYDHLAWVVASVDPGSTAEREGLAVARSIREGADPTIAEFAIVVTDEWQGRGVGKLLTRVLADEARRCGVRKWRALMLVDNERVRKLLSGVGREAGRKIGGDGTVEILYDLG
jgi:L-amino acid N-acyltransferase YncA